MSDSTYADDVLGRDLDPADACDPSAQRDVLCVEVNRLHAEIRRQRDELADLRPLAADLAEWWPNWFAGELMNKDELYELIRRAETLSTRSRLR